MISAAERGHCDNCDKVAPLAMLKYDCGYGVAGYCLECLTAAAADLRESGGSLPAADPWRALKDAGARAEAARESPVLNKTGGSDVPICGDQLEPGESCTLPKGHAGRHTDGGDEWS